MNTKIQMTFTLHICFTSSLQLFPISDLEIFVNCESTAALSGLFFPFFFFSGYHCLDKNLSILALAFPPFRLCVQSEEEKEAFSFLGMTAWMWRHLNLPRATREETVWHDCKWRKIGKAKQSILFILGWKAQQNNLRSHSLVFGRIMLFVSKKVVFKSTFFFEKIIMKTWKNCHFRGPSWNRQTS